MDVKNPDTLTQIREIIDRAISRVNTSIPGTIKSFDPLTQTCEVIPAIKTKTYIDDEVAYVDFPPIVNVPVIFPYAATIGFALTIPIAAGDPCIILFEQRAIENWVENGGSQPPEEGIGSRHHDLTDAVVLLAAPPKPDRILNWEPLGIELRNKLKTSRVTVKDSTIEIVVGTSTIICGSDGSITITGPLSTTMTTGSSVITMLPDGTVTIAAPVKIELTAPILSLIGGAMTAGGNISDAVGSMATMRTQYNSHTHPGGGVPSPQMT